MPSGVDDVLHWMLHEGRRQTRMREFGDAMCRRIVEAGIPLWRAFCGVHTLHPQLLGAAYVWNRDEPGAMRLLATRSMVDDPEYADSPPLFVRNSGKTIRRRLEDADCPLDFPVLKDFKDRGGTDYIARPLHLSDGGRNSITWATDRAGGFSDADLEGLHQIEQMLALIVELQSTRRIAGILLDTYIGPRTGKRVLAGEIVRGSGECIQAVIWYCDLRGFTTLGDRLSSDKLIDLLDDYFEIVGTAVADAGGEVLKFIGDAMLAIFELTPEQDAKAATHAAIGAARTAAKAVAEKNKERRQASLPEIRYGLALHLGEVVYGNIGAPTRLDFTVIGPAVNHAARLERLATDLGQPAVTSESFAAAVAEALPCLGTFALKGVVEKQAVYGIS